MVGTVVCGNLGIYAMSTYREERPTAVASSDGEHGIYVSLLFMFILGSIKDSYSIFLLEV